MLPEQGLDEMTRRRSTIAPIVRSTFAYAVYFGTAVLILASMGFNPMPFLPGAGILGLVVGFGAQALIHDVVSGFFILFENTYLVGDTIEAANAKGSWKRSSSGRRGCAMPMAACTSCGTAT
jgi:moderate conductance mechanosensitive channel